MSRDIVIQKTDMFKTSNMASFLIILFQFIQYFVFVVLYGDAFGLFSTSNFIAISSPKKKIACKTFFALKDRLAIIGRLLCLEAQILLLTYLTSSK